MELLAEHYTPVTARAINGPPLARPDDENPLVAIPPTGLQVVAARLADVGPHDALDAVAHEAAVLRVNVRRLRETVTTVSVTDTARALPRERVTTSPLSPSRGGGRTGEAIPCAMAIP